MGDQNRAKKGLVQMTQDQDQVDKKLWFD